MTYAPIALFTYNRPDHTRKAVESLLLNVEAKDSDIFIFSDGPKNEKVVQGVLENRKYIHTICGFKSVNIIERKKNWGLSKSLIAGISDMTDKFGRVIVVEDDLIVSPYFLRFMNDGLEKYKDDDRVASIAAFINPVQCEFPNTFFLRYFSCWGWATWKRGWEIFNPDAKDLLKRLRWKKNDFNIGGTGEFYGMLLCQKMGLVNSWAVRFYASQFLANKLQLFPGKTLVIQNGMDGSGTHSECDNLFSKMSLYNHPIDLKEIDVCENKYIYSAYSSFYGKNKNPYSIKFMYNSIKSFVRRLLGVDFR